MQKYLTLGLEELDNEKDHINEQVNFSIKQGEFVASMHEDNFSLLNQILVSRDGKLSILIDGKTFAITDTSICERIYYDLFRYSSMCYSNEDINFIISNVKEGKILSMYDTNDINERRERFCALKRRFFDDESMVVLNEYTDVDAGLFKIDYVTRKVDGVLDYNEMKKLIDTFSIEVDDNGQDIIRYRNSLNILTDPYLISCVRASYLFVRIENKLSDSTVISSEEVCSLYNDLTNIMLIDIKVNGNIGLDTIRKYASSSDRITQLFIQELFDNPKYYEILYNYIYMNSCYKKEQVVKEEYYKSDRYMTVESDMVRLVNISKRT